MSNQQPNLQPKLHTDIYTESKLVTNKGGHLVKEKEVDHFVDGKTVEHKHTISKDGKVNVINDDKGKLHNEIYTEAQLVTNKGGHLVKEKEFEHFVDGKPLEHKHTISQDGKVIESIDADGKITKCIGACAQGNVKATQGNVKAINPPTNEIPKPHSEVYRETTEYESKDGHYTKETTIDHKVDGKTVEHKHTIDKDGKITKALDNDVKHTNAIAS
jgi:hypothetical protein